MDRRLSSAPGKKIISQASCPETFIAEGAERENVLAAAGMTAATMDMSMKNTREMGTKMDDCACPGFNLFFINLLCLVCLYCCSFLASAGVFRLQINKSHFIGIMGSYL